MEAKIAATVACIDRLTRRQVFVAEWLEPPFAAGHWLPEMVAAAGGVDVIGRAGEPSFPTAWEVVRQLEPELVVLAPCGFDVARTAAEASQVELPDLGCPVVAVDANAHYSRPAPRVADGVIQLAHLLHPERVADPGLPYRELVGSIFDRPPAKGRRAR
jgi:iron complex transport system substrate-binding protein